MKILLVAATAKEAERLWRRIGGKEGLSKGLVAIQYKDLELNILITGVGLMPTAFHLGEVLTRNDFDLAINFGVAGSFNHQFELGDVVQVKEDMIADAGAEDHEEFIDLAEMNLFDPHEFPYKSGKLKSEFSIPLSISKKVNEVKGISLNKATGSEKTIRMLKEKYDPDVESLEGAAFFYSCLHKKIKCLQLRAISNYVEPRNKDNWQMGKALNNLTDVMIEILEEINAESKKSV